MFTNLGQDFEIGLALLVCGFTLVAFILISRRKVPETSRVLDEIQRRKERRTPVKKEPTKFIAQAFEQRVVPEGVSVSASEWPQVLPIGTTAALKEYCGPCAGYSFSRRCSFKPPPLRRGRRLLVCHDFAGGYCGDRFVQGTSYDQAFRLYYWDLIDIFVYFSHALVTIPPSGWIDVAHRHGTRCLGTFITEWEEGSKRCTELFGTREAAEETADLLTRVAVDYGFDGWLINIENKIEPLEQVSYLIHFLQTLTRLMHERLGDRAQVIWYDSVIMDGTLAWQDVLNTKNKPWFDVCDGIFVNYTWQKDYPKQSAALAQERRWGVYTGIDVYGRNTYGGGGLDCNKAVDVIRFAGVSCALFAPGYVMEAQMTNSGHFKSDDEEDWAEVEAEFRTLSSTFWDLIRKSWKESRPILTLPLYTTFNSGAGCGLWIEGTNVKKGCCWYHLTSQTIEPKITPLGGGSHSIAASITSSSAFDGSSLLQFTGILGADNTTSSSVNASRGLVTRGAPTEPSKVACFRLFECAVPTMGRPLEVRFTTRCNESSDFSLILMISKPGRDTPVEIVLRPPAGGPITSLAESSGMNSSKSDSRVTASVALHSFRPVSCTEIPNTAISGTDSSSLIDTVQALLDTGMTREEVGEKLKGTTVAMGPWTTREYSIRLGHAEIKEIRVVCSRKREHGDSKSVTVVNGSSAFRGSVGEIAIGFADTCPPEFPTVTRMWLDNICPADTTTADALPSNYTDSTVEQTGALTVVPSSELGTEGAPSLNRCIVADLVWEFQAGGTNEDRGISYCDVWGVKAREGKVWIGRAYGPKLRCSLPLYHTTDGVTTSDVHTLELPSPTSNETVAQLSEGDAATTSAYQLTIVLQQIDLLGRRQPFEECAKLLVIL